jgi:hypothetical protein
MKALRQSAEEAEHAKVTAEEQSCQRFAENTKTRSVPLRNFVNSIALR